LTGQPGCTSGGWADVIGLDASVLIAYLNPVDAHHHAATRILLTGTPGEIDGRRSAVRAAGLRCRVELVRRVRRNA